MISTTKTSWHEHTQRVQTGMILIHDKSQQKLRRQSQQADSSEQRSQTTKSVRCVLTGVCQSSVLEICSTCRQRGGLFAVRPAVCTGGPVKSLQTAAGVHQERERLLSLCQLRNWSIFIPTVESNRFILPLWPAHRLFVPLNLECKPPASERRSLQITQYRKAGRDSWFEITRLSHADNGLQAVLTLPNLVPFFFN